jgi:NTP pyrophosphatase (non-canonical NTP hydrolase)
MATNFTRKCYPPWRKREGSFLHIHKKGRILMGRTWYDKFTDFGLKDGIFHLVREEDQKQRAKWGGQCHTPAEWLMFLNEETGELAEAIADWWFRDGELQAIELEAIQAATLALKIAQMARETMEIQERVDRS